MSIRSVYVDFSKPIRPCGDYQFAGYEQEHQATTLQVRLPANFTAGVVYVQFDFQTAAGETILSEPVVARSDTVSIALFQQLTVAGVLRFQVVGRDAADTIVAKTPVGKLLIEKSTYGSAVQMDPAPYRVDQEILRCLESASKAADRADAAADRAALSAGNLLPITTAKLAAGAVTAPKLADGAVTADKLASAAVTGDKLADDVKAGMLPTLAVLGDDSYRLGTLPADGALMRVFLPYMPGTGSAECTVIGSVDRYAVVDTTGRQLTYPQLSQGTYLMKFEPSQFRVVVLDVQNPTLPYNAVTTGTIADAAVTMPKLSTEVREVLSGVLRCKIVSALPEADGEVLTARRSSFSVDNLAKFGDLVSTNWVPLNKAADLTPLTNTKRLRFTLTLRKAAGSGSYRAGQVRLRRWQNNAETVATYGLPPARITEGTTEWDIPLTYFDAPNAAVWSGVNEIMVYVYANNGTTAADGDYTITLSRVRIVDTAIQTLVDPNTIYMLPADQPQASNAYDEYMYIGSGWERIGSTAIDLTDYATRDEVRALAARVAALEASA